MFPFGQASEQWRLQMNLKALVVLLFMGLAVVPSLQDLNIIQCLGIGGITGLLMRVVEEVL